MYHGSISKAFKRTHAFTRIFSLLMHGNCVKSFITFLYCIMITNTLLITLSYIPLSMLFVISPLIFHHSSFFLLTLKTCWRTCVAWGGEDAWMDYLGMWKRLGWIIWGCGGGLSGLFGGVEEAWVIYSTLHDSLHLSICYQVV